MTATGTVEATNLTATTVKADAVVVEKLLTADEVEIGENGIVQIVGTEGSWATATIGTLNIGTGSTFFVDPAYVKIDSLGKGVFASKMLVGKGSVVAIATDDEEIMREMMIDAGMKVYDSFTVGSANSVLAVGQTINLDNGGLIVVDATVNSDGTLGDNHEAIPTPVDGQATTVYFSDGSLLIVDGQALG